ncbi:A24 family peptidase [Sphingomonas sp.]|uniref:prepilin peptidase n=1 Tax=Sphingomonas sp. TaxID=28214 RepID=UPI0025EF4A1C|nr:A24 family peptidase [Sphingomonas sp.]
MAGPQSAALLALLGLILGSFIATLVIRWPHGRSVMAGRSVCDGCGRALGVGELVPLLSALVQRGRCRACGGAINPLHGRIELAAGLIGALAGATLPGMAAPVAALFGWLLLALAALDITEFWLPDVLTATLALAGVASWALGIGPALADRLIGGAAGFGALWAIGAGYRMLRGREGLGGGDPKLLGAIGLWLGWRLLPAVVLVAALVGLGVVLLRWAGGRAVDRGDALPLGALLAIAAYPAEIIMLSSAA